jgi:hypothetical protein
MERLPSVRSKLSVNRQLAQFLVWIFVQNNYCIYPKMCYNNKCRKEVIIMFTQPNSWKNAERVWALIDELDKLGLSNEVNRIAEKYYDELQGNGLTNDSYNLLDNYTAKMLLNDLEELLDSHR